jgi:hypothetical protein
MIEIVNSANKIDEKELRMMSQSFAFMFLEYNSSFESSKLSSSKINKFAEKVLLWMRDESSDMDSAKEKLTFLNMSYDFLKLNSAADNKKISSSSLFTHANNLMAYAQDGV